LNLLERVAAVLNGAGMAHALIGAVALAAHGVARSTVDQDLLVVDRACLGPALWKPLEDEGIRVEIRRGDVSDPLAGVVRFEAAGERPEAELQTLPRELSNLWKRITSSGWEDR
jgi:hypothetical protein